MPKGLPKAYIKKWGISKTAWRKFRAGALTKGIRTRTRAIKRRIRRNPRRKSNPKRRVMRTARKKKRGGGKSIQRTVEKFVGVLAFLGPGIRRGNDVMQQTGNIGEALVTAATTYAGIRRDGKFDWTLIGEAWMPFLAFKGASGLAHKVSGIIRRL